MGAFKFQLALDDSHPVYFGGDKLNGRLTIFVTSAEKIKGTKKGV